MSTQGRLVLLFLANPQARLATGRGACPQPWGAIGQILPIGAAGTAIRSAAFYDAPAAGRPSSSSAAGPSPRPPACTWRMRISNASNICGYR